MSIKSKVFAAAATLTLVGGIGAASAATTPTMVAVVDAMVALFAVTLFAVALFAAMSTGRGQLLFSTGRRTGLPPLCLSPGRVPAGPGRPDRSGGMGR